MQGTGDDFAECFIGEGNLDVTAVMRALKEVGFAGALIDDHVPRMVGDDGWAPRARAYQTGYLHGPAAGGDGISRRSESSVVAGLHPTGTACATPRPQAARDVTLAPTNSRLASAGRAPPRPPAGCAGSHRGPAREHPLEMAVAVALAEALHRAPGAPWPSAAGTGASVVVGPAVAERRGGRGRIRRRPPAPP